MGFNPLKIVRGLFGGPLVKGEVQLGDQVQDKQAERRRALAAIIFAALAGLALVIWAWPNSCP